MTSRAVRVTRLNGRRLRRTPHDVTISASRTASVPIAISMRTSRCSVRSTSSIPRALTTTTNSPLCSRAGRAATRSVNPSRVFQVCGAPESLRDCRDWAGESCSSLISLLPSRSPIGAPLLSRTVSHCVCGAWTFEPVPLPSGHRANAPKRNRQLWMLPWFALARLPPAGRAARRERTSARCRWHSRRR